MIVDKYSCVANSGDPCPLYQHLCLISELPRTPFLPLGHERNIHKNHNSWIADVFGLHTENTAPIQPQFLAHGPAMAFV